MEIVIHVRAAQDESRGGREAERNGDHVPETGSVGRGHGHVQGPVHGTENRGIQTFVAMLQVSAMMFKLGSILSVNGIAAFSYVCNFYVYTCLLCNIITKVPSRSFLNCATQQF